MKTIAPDAIVVVAYGRIIPPWMLALPRLGCINLHASLLPKYRGAAPIQWAVAMGETVTGNTTMLLEEGLDTGPILLQQALAIRPEQTSADLFDVLAEGGAPLVVETLGRPGRWNPAAPAAERCASHACSAARARRRAHGLCGAHGDGTEESLARISAVAGRVYRFEGKKLIVHRMEVAAADRVAAPRGARPDDCTSKVTGCWLRAPTIPGLNSSSCNLKAKSALPAAEFLRGMRVAAGARLG